MENTKDYNRKIQINIDIIMIFISIIGLFVCLINITSLPESSYSIILLPAIYIICLIILVCSKRRKKIHIISSFLMVFYSVQYLFFPLYICCSGTMNLNGYNIELKEHIADAVLLQSLVLICVTFYLMLSKKNNNICVSNNLIKKIENSKKSKRFIFILVFIAIVVLVVYPQFKLKFRFIFYSNNENYYSFLDASKTVRGSMPIYVYVLGLWFLQITKLLLIYYLIIFLWNLSKGKDESIYIILSAIVIGISCMITTEDKAATIFSAISIILLMLKLYPKKARNIVFFLGGLLFTFILIGFFIIPMNKPNGSMIVAYKLNAYFSGTINVAGGFLMDTSNRLTTFFGDILRSIPLINHYFTNLPMSYIEFNRALGYDIKYNSQIIPIISQGYYYFGIIGAILYPITLICIAKRFYNKMITSTFTFEFYKNAMLFVFSFLGLFLYDLALTFAQILNYCLPMCIIYFITKKGRK